MLRSLKLYVNISASRGLLYDLTNHFIRYTGLDTFIFQNFLKALLQLFNKVSNINKIYFVLLV